MKRAIGVVAAAVLAGVLAFAVRVASSATEERWSDPATWHGRLPRAGDAVSIPSGKAIVLDVDPPSLASLTIDGRLRFSDTDVTLHAGGIAVHGELRIGSDAHPFAHRARIVLGGTPDGRGAIAVSNGGRLELHGAPRTSWTVLGATALQGDSGLVLADRVDWDAGDRLAVAPSGFDASEAEEVVVRAVSGTRVTLAAPLRFRHWGEIVDGVDERAEVGLLSHAIAITSEPHAAARGYGGAVIVLRGGTLRASNVEFRGLGQRGRLGRYPIHFHEAGDESASSVVDSSVDHSLNRCIVIHGTNGVTVRGDVAFDTIGHCYFLEDGIERGNTFERDLGMATHAPAPGDAVLATDVRPATFWIANPDNVVRGNHAAGSEGNGFWYDLAASPGGLAVHARDVRPRRIALGAFADNVAHANEHDGLFVDNLRNPPGVFAAPNYEPPVPAVFARMTSYKNRRHGVWLRGRDLALEGPHLADNAIGATLAAADSVLRDGLVIGETANETGPPKPDDPGFPIRGFEYYDGPVAVESTRFVNFEPDARREASALSALEFSPFFMDPNQTLRDVSFSNAQPIYFRPFDVANAGGAAADGYRSTAIRDLDGSLTGVADRTVVYQSPVLSLGCTPLHDANAAVCAGRFGSLFILDDPPGGTGIGPIRVAAVDIAGAPSIVLAGNPASNGTRANFQTNVPSGRRYAVTFLGRVPTRVRLAIHGLDDGDAVRLTLPQLRGCGAPGDVTLTARGTDRRAFDVKDIVCSPSSGR